MSITAVVIAVLVGIACLAVGIIVGQRLARRSQADLDEQLRALSAQAVSDSRRQVLELAGSGMHATEQMIVPVKDTLAQLQERLTSLTSRESAWQAQLYEQVETVRVHSVELSRQTQALSTALRQPQVRGHWGEMQLRRSLELAGVTAHCVFDEQVSVHGDDGVLRPDVVVHLPGGKSVVVDSKTPLDAFLDVTQAVTPEQQTECLQRHARLVRQHVDALASKAYWSQFTPAPEFVVLFLPGEAIFAQALETDPSLLDDAAGKHVMMATPVTIIAMLKSIGYAWTQQALADNAREVSNLGRELYDRLRTTSNHLDKLGKSLTGAVAAYNKAVGSIETRVLVSARKMRDLRISEEDIDSPSPITDAVRPITAAELLTVAEDLAPRPATDDLSIDGEPGREQLRRVANE